MTDAATPAVADALTPANILEPVSVPVPVPAADKADPAPPEAAPATADKEGPADDAAKDEDSEPKRTAKARISELYGQKKAAERAADQALRELRETQRQLQEIRQNTDPNDWQQQQRADVRSAVKEERLTQLHQEAVNSAQAAVELRERGFMAKVEAARERMPDLDDALRTFSQLPVSETAADIISESDKAAEISYFLAKNEGEARRIAGLPPHKQAYELAKIEARVSPAVPRRTSNAPPPVPMVGASSAPSTPSLKEMSVADIAKELGYGR
jgi:hypothetical protein